MNKKCRGFEIHSTAYREIITYPLCSKTRTLGTRQRAMGDEAKGTSGKKMKKAFVKSSDFI